MTVPRHIFRVLSAPRARGGARAVALLLAAVAWCPARGQTVTATLPAGSAPGGVAVNPATNTAYVTNYSGNSVTVIDGAASTSTTVAVGGNPDAIAVNPATATIYVANESDGTVTVLNGATNSTSTVVVGTEPVAIALNPVTNTIYVVNSGSASVTTNENTGRLAL